MEFSLKLKQNNYIQVNLIIETNIKSQFYYNSTKYINYSKV